MSKMVTNNGAARSMNGDHGTNGHEQGPMPIAVVGMSCRFPQAPDLKSFWQFMLAGGDAITEVPPERFDIEAVYDPRPATPGRIVTRYGGFLDGVDLFDAAFFGISPREAVRVDPQQRLLLEVSWEALEDAGIVPDTLEGSPTGVFVGMCYNDYEDLQISDPDSMDIYANTGGFRSVTPGRVSFALGLAGPSINVDAACASSLVSVHLACQSIRSGESTLAIAAGVNLILQPEISIGFSQANMLSPDGRCKAFDSRANGFVRSEGIGVVVLKPLAEALADGNPIYAVIRSTMVNNDGRSNGMMTTPSRPGQQDLLRKAYHSAGINPADVQYIEAHGTGTSSGDPVEAGALGAVLGEGRSADQPCWLGSVKTNVGHTEGAAGIAGLIKLALSLKNEVIPASQHCLTPNPKIPWDELKLQVVRENSPWPQYGKPAIAGVNSFGISGINAHVVLEAPPTTTTTETAVDEQPLLLPLSGRSPEALKAQAQSYRDFLTSDQIPALIDIVTTASRNRSHHAERLAIVGATRDELVAQLDMLLDGQRTSSMATSTATEEIHPRVVFVCPGQGSQWPGMARLLLTSEPVFRQVIEECDQVMRAFVSWSLLELLEAEVPPPELERIDVIQPALFAMEVALGALWQSRGIRPDAVIGHSMGEVAAAYLAGILSLEDAARVICRRSQLMRRASGQGAMAVVDLAAPEAEAALVGFEDRLSVAVMNGPRSTVISGEPQALETVLTQLREQGVFCRHVKVDVASHSPQVDPLLDELAEVLAAVQPQAGEVPLYSTVQAEVIVGQTCTADYWVRNLRQPVRFGPTVQQLLTDGYTVFIELSPHPILLPSVEQGVQHVNATATLLASMRRDEDGRRVLLEGMGRLWTQGYPVDWQLIVPAGGKIVPLPHYPWQRERFWLEASATGSGAARRPGASGHPLLGMYLQSSAQPEAHIWEAEFRSTSIPYLRDHQVQEMVVLPAAAYLELALAAAVAACGPGSHVVEQMSFNRMLVLNESTAQVIQVTLTTDGFGTADVQIASRPADADHAEPWVIHGRGSVRLVQEHPNGKHPQMIAYDAVQTRCTQVLDNTVMYQSLQERGYGYGPAFQGIAQVWTGGDEALAQLTPDIAQVSTDAYQVHPALLDSCFQALVAAVPNYVGAAVADQTYLPVMLQSLRVLASPSAACWSYVRFAPVSDPQANTIEGDVLVLAADGTVIVEAHGIRVQRMEPTASATSVNRVDEWLYNVQWQPVERPAATATPATGTWLLFADRQGVAKSLRAQLKLQEAHVISVTPGATFQRLAADAYRVNPSDPTSMQQLLVEVFGPDQPACRGIVHLWSLGMATPTTAVAEELTSAADLGCISVMHLLQAINQANWPTAPRLWLVTAGSQQVMPEDTTVAIAQAPLWGLGRVIAYEHSDLRCTRIDLGATLDELTRDALFTEIWSGSSEEEIALRGSARYVARLSQYASVETGATSDTTARVPAVVGQDALRLEVLTPGQLDSLNLRATTRPAPAPGQIEIQVRAAALNFLDVMRAMGIYPGQPDGAIPLGIECAGTVTAVGDEVEEFRVGDDVIAHVPTTNCTFSSFLLVQPAHAAPKPAQLSFEEAATLPVA
ncbi:MAG: acyltransferase domain-containing protein, partial [Chloroflexaceae bacterium]